MSSELIIRYTCDRCQRRAAEGDADGFHPELRVRIGDVDRLVDLCDTCARELLGSVVEVLPDLGRPADTAAARPRPASAPAAQPASTRQRATPGASDPDVRCKLCPHVATTVGAIKQHVRASHGMGIPDYRAAAVRPDSALGRGVAA